MPDGVYIKGQWEPLPQNSEALQRKPISAKQILGTTASIFAAIAAFGLVVRKIKGRSRNA